MAILHMEVSYTYFWGFFLCLVTMASGSSIIWSWRVPPFKVVYLFIHLYIIFLEHSHPNGCTILQYFIAILMGTPSSSILECILSRESSKYCAFWRPCAGSFGAYSTLLSRPPLSPRIEEFHRDLQNSLCLLPKMTVLLMYTPGAWCRSVAMSAKVGTEPGLTISGIYSCTWGPWRFRH